MGKIILDRLDGGIDIAVRVDLGWLLTGMTDATGIFEIVPGFFASLLIAVIVAKLTAEPNKKAVEIFDQGIKAETE